MDTNNTVFLGLTFAGSEVAVKQMPPGTLGMWEFDLEKLRRTGVSHKNLLPYQVLSIQTCYLLVIFFF